MIFEACSGARAVALVLDPHFGGRTAAIVQQMPVWILSSTENDLAVQAVRTAGRHLPVTLLLARPNESLKNTLERALYAIDEHCGAESESHPYDSLCVYGVTWNLAPETLAELGFESITQTTEGFTATKRRD